ncbi:RagB/SusD family nutrient uptake outer membrane protein [Pararhodonellum marinum]|uniref:RagB/SusD family nutrient uptake outer membrane protein n=1 Tax=Pararhodonellum marinum TaxID=2755358 RepID=UPI001E35B685|nr:RagB/SusD family nutrient uptake outer membrane protein [Pararhodonellum marinum]
MKISTKIKAGLTGFAFMWASSCDVIDTLPATIIPDAEAFATAARIESIVFGVYEAAQRGFFNGSSVNGRGYPFGAATVQQGDMRGEDMYNDQLFYEITYTGTYNPNTANNNNMWSSLYRVINRANITLEGLEPALSEGVLTQDQRNRYRGEMLFMRALSHHEVLIHFARPYTDDPGSMGIPYRIFPINDVPLVTEGEAVGRTTVGEDYAQLIADLDEAEQLLPEGGGMARANKGAAIGLKIRVKQHMGDWQGVLTEFAKVTGYAVTANPAAPFRGTSTDNIFSFINSAESNGTVNGALPAMYGNPADGGRGLVKVSPLIWRSNFWHPEDTRRELLTSRNAAGIYSAKYIDPITRADPTPILRYSELVLTAAEANARLGNLDVAVTLLNSVRDRALPASVPSFTAAGLGGQEGVLTAIFNEKRIEFLGEGRRWPDIHRLSGEGRMDGVPAKASSRQIGNLDFYTTDRVIPTDHAIAYSSNAFIWPIPLEEILTNATAPIPQNPGY